MGGSACFMFDQIKRIRGSKKRNFFFPWLFSEMDGGHVGSQMPFGSLLSCLAQR